MTKGEILKRAGQLLFYTEWTSGLARLVCVNPRLVRRMLKGEADVDDETLHMVEIALRDRGNALEALLEEWPEEVRAP